MTTREVKTGRELDDEQDYRTHSCGLCGGVVHADDDTCVVDYVTTPTSGEQVVDEVYHLRCAVMVDFNQLVDAAAEALDNRDEIGTDDGDIERFLVCEDDVAMDSFASMAVLALLIVKTRSQKKEEKKKVIDLMSRR